MAIVDKAWVGDASRFTDEQYERSCVLDRKSCGGDWADKPVKSRCSLPIKEPNGDLNKNAVSAAAGRLSSVTDACSSAISSAKSKLRSAYKECGMTVPDSLKSSDPTGPERNDLLDQLEAQFGVEPGVPRHGAVGVRGVIPFEFRDDSAGDGYLGTLTGHFAVFNRWTEIDSFWEGRFMESLAPGCFSKTFQENLKGMRCLVQHGRDPSIGLKPLGPIRSVEQDSVGAAYEVPLLDTSYNRDLLPGLKAGLFGASFRFQVVREEVNTDPGRSDYNPDGIEERTITEAKVREFGPVTFPAYEDATAGVRSLNDLLVDGDMELFMALSRSRRVRSLHQAPESTTSSEVAAPEDAEREGEDTAPSTEAPDRKEYLRPTPKLSAARQPLRTSRTTGEPSWKL